MQQLDAQRKRLFKAPDSVDVMDVAVMARQVVSGSVLATRNRADRNSAEATIG